MKRRAQPWLGTLVDIQIADALPDAALQAAFSAAFGTIRQIQTLMSFHAADSDIGRYNRAPVGAVLTLDAHTCYVLRASLQLHQASDGLFDIRVASRLAEWNVLPGYAEQTIPDWVPQQTAFALLPANRVHKLRPDWLDLGGIAKGYAVDQTIAALQHSGVTSACVNAGGDVRVTGDAAWHFAIRDPEVPQQAAQMLTLHNQALATSGSYFSQTMVQGQPVCALINGRSGQAMTDTGSVSVLAAECLWADALTKVVAATQDAQHPCLAQFGAQAFIITVSAQSTASAFHAHP